MKKVLLFIAIVFSSSLAVEAQNLILNPSCDDTLVAGNIPHWQEILGTSWRQRCSSPNAFAGACYFFPGAVSIGELEQAIDISSDSIAVDNGNKNYYFTGYVVSFGQSPADESNIYLDFYNSFDTLLTSYHLGSYNQTSAWLRVDSTLLAPSGARKIVIKLRSVRRSGSNNDGYYDELYLGSSPLTGISAHTSSSEFSIYPNPSKGDLNISLMEFPTAKTQLTLVDMLGRKLKVMDISSQNTSMQLELPNGIYTAIISTATDIYTRKIIIER